MGRGNSTELTILRRNMKIADDFSVISFPDGMAFRNVHKA